LALSLPFGSDASEHSSVFASAPVAALGVHQRVVEASDCEVAVELIAAGLVLARVVRFELTRQSPQILLALFPVPNEKIERVLLELPLEARLAARLTVPEPALVCGRAWSWSHVANAGGCRRVDLDGLSCVQQSRERRGRVLKTVEFVARQHVEVRPHCGDLVRACHAAGGVLRRQQRRNLAKKGSRQMRICTVDGCCLARLEEERMSRLQESRPIKTGRTFSTGRRGNPPMSGLHRPSRSLEPVRRSSRVGMDRD